MVPSGPRFRVGDQVAPRPGTMTRFGNDRARGVVIDLGTDGADTILQVRWADGSVSSVYPWELRLQEAVTMSNARKLIEQVLQGEVPAQVVEDIASEPTPMGPPVGDYPGATIPPNPEDPSFMYRVSFESGCDGPHAHLVTLDGQGNGTTEMEQGSQHAVLRYEVQPDPKDGHTHTLDRTLRQDVPTSLNPDGQDTSFHLLATDPNRFEY